MADEKAAAATDKSSLSFAKIVSGVAGEPVTTNTAVLTNSVESSATPTSNNLVLDERKTAASVGRQTKPGPPSRLRTGDLGKRATPPSRGSTTSHSGLATSPGGETRRTTKRTRGRPLPTRSPPLSRQLNSRRLVTTLPLLTATAVQTRMLRLRW